MKIKYKISSKFKVTIAGLCLLLFYLYPLIPARATPFDCNPLGSSPSRATGLVTTPSITGSRFGTDSGSCIVNDPKAAFVPYKIPVYEDLKSLYYTQSKSTKQPLTSDSAPLNFTGDTVYLRDGDLTISTSNIGASTGVVFVEGDLNITGNYCHALPSGTCNPSSNNVSGTAGTVFVVKNNVYIDKNVNRIDAVIISSGTIYTGSDTPSTECANNSVLYPLIANGQLVINGSLISLSTLNPIVFCRELVDNSKAAEKINHQIKYLVILRNLLSDTLQRWSEISADEEIPDAPASLAPPEITVPPPPPPPPPASLCTVANPLSIDSCILQILDTIISI